MERTTSALIAVDPDQVVETHRGLARADQRVGRAAGAEERRGHDRARACRTIEKDRQQRVQAVRAGGPREEAVTAHPPDDDPAEHEAERRDEPAQPGDAVALPGLRDVGTAEDGVADDAGHVLGRTGLVQVGARERGRDVIGGPTHDQTPFIPHGR